MEITKDLLSQYSSMQSYVEELTLKKNRISKEMRRLEDRITTIEAGEMVIDSVSGGSGGNQHFVIRGVPVPEYSQKKNKLYLKRISYGTICDTLEKQEHDLLLMQCEIEKFIADISDINIRRIVNLRFIENMKWNDVATCIGGGNTEDSVRKAFDRYMEKS